MHKADIAEPPINVRFRGKSGQHMLASSLSAFDPTRTSGSGTASRAGCIYSLPESATDPLGCIVLNPGAGMKRREFITVVGGVAVTWPLVARAQQRERPAHLGYVWIGAKNSERSTLVGMRKGLQQLGYAEGRDFVIEERYAELEPDRLPDILAELVRSKVDLILSPGNAVTRAAMQATSSIPIIATTPDLLASGFVSSLARPGGNVTGISLTAGAELSEKWLDS
jgi:hypothetical protein